MTRRLSAPKRPPAADLTIQQIDAIVAEIADYRLTSDQMQEDINAALGALKERVAALREACRPELERLAANRQRIEASLSDRLQVVEQWAEAHKDSRFAPVRSLKLLHGVIGFRLTPGKLAPMKGWTLASCALALKRRLWGRDFLHAPKVDVDAVLRGRDIIAGKRGGLAAVGLQIVQEDKFYVELAREGSDALATQRTEAAA